MSDHLTLLTPAARLLGREITSRDADDGAITSRFIARDDFANRHGTVHGGFLAAMLDSAASMALFAQLPADLSAVTTRLDTSFHKPAPLGPLVGVARVTQRDESSAQVDAELRDTNGIVLASARATFKIRRKR